MVHDKEEFDKIYKLIKDRKFSIRQWSKDYEDYYWIDFPNKLMNPENFEFGDGLYMRVYFNEEPCIYKFKKKVKRLLYPVTCGNDKCMEVACPYHYDKYENGNYVEYLWRCIWGDDNDYVPHAHE
jgi:hypothetical protein